MAVPKLIGGMSALVALAAGILAKVEPVTCVMRAGLAFLLGLVATQVWYVFFTVRVHHGHEESRETHRASEAKKDAA